MLVGLVLNATFGWWWADPAAGLVLAALAVREGRAAWRGDGCCAPVRLDTAAPGGSTSTSTAVDVTIGGRDAAATGCGCASGCTASCCAGETR